MSDGHGEEPRRVTMTPPDVRRDQVLLLVLVLLSLGVGYVCLRLVLPFVSPLTWAITLAVIAHPLYAWLNRTLGRSAFAAAIAALVVTVVVAGTALWVGSILAREAGTAVETGQHFIAERRWTGVVERFPALAPVADWLEREVASALGREQALARAGQWVRSAAAVSIDFAVAAVVTVYFLFFFFRDDERLLRAVPHFLPLSRDETRDVLRQMRDAIQAMVWGTLGVAVIQGALGGLMFWWLDLPAPLLWGTVMTVLSVLPMFGAALVWGPVALYLALTGDIGAAVILTLWGAVVIGLIDNFLKPWLVKNKLRLHAVPVFIAILGGLYAFGPTGVVLGPVTLALAMGLLDVWKRHVTRGAPA